MALNARTPNHVEVLAAQDSITSAATYVTATNRRLDVNATATLGGQAIPASGLTTAVAVQIVDGSGNQIASFGGGTQYTNGAAPPANPIGPTLQWSDGAAWQTVSTAKPLPITIAGGLSNPLPVSLASTTVTGTVTANAGTNLNTSLLALESGGNLATLAGTVSASKVNITVSNSTLAVTQSGTWNIATVTAVTGITNALPAGSNVIGHVIADTGSTTAVTQATASNLNAQVVGAGAQNAAVSGNPVLDAGYASAAEPSNVGADGRSQYHWLDQKGRQVVTMQAATNTNSSVAGNASSMSLLASNTSRKGATIYNDSTATLYIAFSASAASTTAYVAQIPPNGYYEAPYGYTGQIYGIWSSATGNARINEIT